MPSKIEMMQKKGIFSVEELQVISRALETHRDLQFKRNWDAISPDGLQGTAEQPQILRELNATEALLTRIS